jgi:hypothetical protein
VILIRECSHETYAVHEGTAEECALRCQCGCVDKKKKHIRDVANECTCPPYHPDTDFPSLVGAVLFLDTKSKPDIACCVGV